jgi:hypothetical protein
VRDHEKKTAHQDDEALKLVSTELDRRLTEGYRKAVKEADKDRDAYWETAAINAVLENKDRSMLTRLLRRGALGPKGLALAADLLQSRREGK